MVIVLKAVLDSVQAVVSMCYVVQSAVACQQHLPAVVCEQSLNVCKKITCFTQGSVLAAAHQIHSTRIQACFANVCAS